MKRLLIVIPCFESPDEGGYDKYVLAPEFMERDKALETVENVVVDVRERMPEDYQWDDIEERLTRAGFDTIESAVPNCAW